MEEGLFLMSSFYAFLLKCVKVVFFKLDFFVIKEQLKMKDQSLRKLQQEMDSLTFRNQQLAKRVELLQDELSLSETRGKKNKVCAKDANSLLAYLLIGCQRFILISNTCYY